MLKVVVIEHKIVSYDYFMDRMQQYELQMFIDMLPWAFKHDSEQTRLVLWGILSPYMKKKQSPEELLPLVTDCKEKEPMLDNATADKIRQDILKQWQKN